jgi:DNA ligase OB-like domain
VSDAATRHRSIIESALHSDGDIARKLFLLIGEEDTTPWQTMPREPLDGELRLGRRSFDELSAIVPVVVGRQPGLGKPRGQVGALEVESGEFRRFFVGSGRSDALRRDPPAIGSVITYRYRDLTPSGLPRLASYPRRHEFRERYFSGSATKPIRVKPAF